MSGWELVKKTTVGGGYRRKGKWREVPCVAINKHSIVFNKLFLDAYGFKTEGEVNTHILVFLDKDNRRIGFRALGEEDDRMHGFKITPNTKNSVDGKISYKGHAEVWPDLPLSQQYPCELNERIITVELSQGETRI